MMKLNRFLISAVLLVLPITTVFAAGFPWYAGASAGASSLRPETQNSPFKIDSSVTFGGGAFVGFDISKRISVELAYNYLGNATLSSANGKTDIGYSALSAGGLLYLLGNSALIADRKGFAGFLRLGISSMDNSASIPLDREDSAAIWAGVGVEWPFSNNLSLRAELTSFDGDAQAARASLMYRPRTNTRGVPIARPPKRQPPPAPVISKPAPPVTLQKPAIAQPNVERVQKPTALVDSGCLAPVVGEPVNAQGCAMFSGVLRGVDFVSGTATLTPVGTQQLDRLSINLMRHPSLILEIQAHTESFGSVARAKHTAKLRSIAVARHLAGRGVPVKRLRARAFGHSQPLASDNSVAGRARNNRIVLRVLP